MKIIKHLPFCFWNEEKWKIYRTLELNTAIKRTWKQRTEKKIRIQNTHKNYYRLYGKLVSSLETVWPGNYYFSWFKHRKRQLCFILWFKYHWTSATYVLICVIHIHIIYGVIGMRASQLAAKVFGIRKRDRNGVMGNYYHDYMVVISENILWL